MGSSLSLALITASMPARSWAQDKYFDAAGTRIRYVEQGSGAPVELVHGFANTLEIWANTRIVQDLARNYHVIAFDLRGHGKSDRPHEPSRYGRELGFDLVRLLDHLGIQRAHVVGYSLGGYTLSQLLTLRPERILSATLIAGRADSTGTRRRRVLPNTGPRGVLGRPGPDRGAACVSVGAPRAVSR
jgi:pimeloyl-ACP methyl ester carboxylesterase